MAAKKAALMIDEMYQVLEVWYPYYRLKEAGLEVNFLAKGVKVKNIESTEVFNIVITV